MRFAILSLIAAGALAVSAGAADARPPGYRGGNYHNNYYSGYRGGYAHPSYYRGYSYPSSGFGVTIGGPRGGFSFGSGSVYPSYGYGYYGRPYYGGYGYRGYGSPWRW